jgi:membrane-bound serine protease (ClpP class)
VLGLGGVAAFVAGSVILIDTEMPGYGINLGVIAGFTVSTGAFFLLALGMVLRTRRHPVVSGAEEMIGASCEALEDFEQQGKVRAHSEIWSAHSSQPMKKGDKAVVTAMNGLILEITPQKEEEKTS